MLLNWNNPISGLYLSKALGHFGKNRNEKFMSVWVSLQYVSCLNILWELQAVSSLSFALLFLQFQKIRQQEEKKAIEESEALIKRLQKEEILRYEEAKKAKETQQQTDEELAKHLAASLEEVGNALKLHCSPTWYLALHD